MRPFSILVVDDNPDFLKAAGHALSRDPRVTSVEYARGGPEALEEVTRSHPAVVLMDVHMPRMSGIAAARRMKAAPGCPKVVLMSLYASAAIHAAITAVGIDGFVFKSDLVAELPGVLDKLIELTVRTPESTPPATGRRTILVVDDEDSVRALTRTILSMCEYRILEARTGDEACAISEGYPCPIDLLVTDVVLPGTDGIELARRIKVSRPGIRTILMSGYSDEVLSRNGNPLPDVLFLPKPFNLNDLTNMVREALEAGQPRRADAERGCPATATPPPVATDTVRRRVWIGGGDR